ncbi:hypothetical protein [Streptomyces boncukensis]|uniref:Uncharacterized protein n=1 Tax=Streptomyces boncukensis TaxID=2711219 RepID=A0A6G4X3S5_9ACTN|nr:hypothetical protein [Streptomyces boncukensis]NGO71321.1 hypothetical protein [Streptomyces boncukensis]
MSDKVPELTIEGIAAALPVEHRERFEDEARRASAPRLATFLGMSGLPGRPVSLP